MLPHSRCRLRTLVKPLALDLEIESNATKDEETDSRQCLPEAWTDASSQGLARIVIILLVLPVHAVGWGVEEDLVDRITQLGLNPHQVRGHERRKRRIHSLATGLLSGTLYAKFIGS